MKLKLDTAITTILVLCALVTTGLLIRREFAPPPAAPGQVDQKPVLIKDWRAHLDKGIRLGPATAPVQLIEFADFECPFCSTFHKTLKTLRERYPTQVALIFVHYPLPMHRFAEPAARVAECAGDQGRFEFMYDQLFEQQEAFGLKPWSELAAEAGVPDMAAFDACVKSSEPVARVAAGKELGAKLNVQGTPTLVVNGWKTGQPPTLEQLDGMVKKILAGNSPFP